MEFQINEAIELVKALAETENLTHSQALGAFVAEAGLEAQQASELKAAFFEEYTLSEMASDSLTSALHSVFVTGISEEAEEIQEVSTKETSEGTKYKVRVKDRASGSSYSRYATRAKIAELRANPNIASVELSDYGDAGEDNDGQKTAGAKGGGKDYDGDGKVESSSKEHAGVVHNAIQRKKGGTPDGKDTRKEEYALDENRRAARSAGGYVDDSKKQTDPSKDGFTGISGSIADIMKQNKAIEAANKKKKTQKEEVEVEEGIDFKGARREDDRRKKERDEKEKKSPSSKDYRLAMGKFRPGASNAERAEGGRDVMREKGTSPTKNGKKMFEQYLELRAGKKKVAEEDKLKEEYLDETGKRDQAIRDRIAMFKKGNIEHTPPRNWDPEANRGKGATVSPKQAEKRRRKALRSEEAKVQEGYVIEADLVDAGRENASQRSKKKLTGEGVDNSTNVKLMPVVDESVIIENDSAAVKRVAKGSVNESLRSKIREMSVQEECCPKCGTPECTCESKKEEKPKKKKAKLDEAGMPILEYSRNNATGPTPEMINPGKDPEGDVGVMNPKGKPKRYKNKGEAPGDRRPNDPSGPELPNEKGTVPNGSGV